MAGRENPVEAFVTLFLVIILGYVFFTILAPLSLLYAVIFLLVVFAFVAGILYQIFRR